MVKTTPKYFTENIRQETALNTKATYSYKVPLHSYFQKIVVQFFAGCSGFVEVNLTVNGQPIFPYGGDPLAYDASPPMSFDIGLEVFMGDMIEYIVNNGDTNAHTVPCLLVLQVLPEK